MTTDEQTTLALLTRIADALERQTELLTQIVEQTKPKEKPAPKPKSKRKRRKPEPLTTHGEKARRMLEIRARTLNNRFSIRIADIANELGCHPNALYKHAGFMERFRADKDYRLSWGIPMEGVHQ